MLKPYGFCAKMMLIYEMLSEVADKDGNDPKRNE